MKTDETGAPHGYGVREPSTANGSLRETTEDLSRKGREVRDRVASEKKGERMHGAGEVALREAERLAGKPVMDRFATDTDRATYGDDQDVSPKPDAIPDLTPEEAAASRSRIQTAVRRPEPVMMPPAVPRRFQKARFATTQPRTVQFQEALELVRRWIRAVVAGEHAMLALIGPKGTSKSHLLYCAAWDLYEKHHVKATCHRWYILVDELRYGRIKQRAEGGAIEIPPHQVRQELFRQRVLLLDEVRPTSGTDFDAMELSKLSMNAYDDLQSVLLTCNWKNLEEMMGGPAADRFTQFTLTGPSIRADG